ncbi:MAG: hypothetical protein HY328_01210 [Chloroflexi bacterium]|nr:hypothetical protein [Chloroflexota bacterium]
MDVEALELTIRIPNQDFEHLVRRIVREELLRLLDRQPSIVENWQHEGEPDEAGDERLLQDALAVLDEYANQPDAWTNWAEFEAELDRAEVAGELPD